MNLVSRIRGVKIIPVERFSDRRGWTAEVFRADQSGTFCPAMVYISCTEPGTIRGPHEHDNQTDWFGFIGPGNFEVHLWDNRADDMGHVIGKSWPQFPLETHEVWTLGESLPACVIIPPGVVHGYQNASDEHKAYCLNLPNRLYKGWNKEEAVDETRWESNPESPFKIERASR